MMDSPSAFRRRRRRRVADENRKRAPRACDRCKARKSKCIESLAGACQRCSLSNLTCRFDREKSPQDGVQGRSSPRVGDQVAPTHVGGSPEENIAIDSHQTERVLWPHFLSRLREAFSLDSQTAPEVQDMVAMQAHITRPKIPQPAEISRLRAAIEAFPPRPVADFLLSVVIKHGTDTFFYFDQAQFLADIDHFYNEPNSNLRSDSSFVCLAMAAFALGSQWTVLERPEGPTLGPRPEDGDPGQVFSSQAKALIPDIIDRPCLRSIQAPFVLGVYLMPASAIGSSYVYMGLALRKALAFDLHQNTDDQTLNEREREVRRRLWWSIYSLEKCTTVKLNRPRSINIDIITVPLPAPLASLDSAQTFNNIQLQIAYARLIKILDRVAEPGDWLTDATKPTRSARAEADLREWKKSLPQEFKLENIHPKDSSYRAVFHLYLNYYYAWIAMGKVSLVTVARAKLRYHFGRASEMPHIDETVDQLSKACSKAGRKLLQLFENLTRTRNISRFSFTDFQGCSIAVIVTLVSGILERDSAYEARVAFGLDCLRSMSAGNMTAKMGVRFVEALQSITNEAIEKLKQTSSFTERSAIAEESNLTSEYNQWAEWLARQDQRQTTDETPSSGDPLVTESVLPIQQTPTWPVTQTHVPGLASWDSTGRELLTPVSLVPQVVPHETNMSRQTPATDNDFLSVLYTDEQTFLMGLTGLDVLDFSGFSTQL
ncbi:fungal-specific transcription factor domain-containing protein [Dactylonectria macrodidyma]|uniref:Fungal-specific transcription factor domain-containing protein n=1 Tax=Dactylonectria macrodidyma TaxID=307937 RepID=A0A9P9JL43_9HYPO|nr:fungal-specific transcription factor domain-containing protein [Dactylonectria macrodidyma]